MKKSEMINIMDKTYGKYYGNMSKKPFFRVLLEEMLQHGMLPPERPAEIDPYSTEYVKEKAFINEWDVE